FTVYVNGTEIAYEEITGYAFPSTIEENTVVKIFTKAQPTVRTTYENASSLYSMTVTHDRVTTVDHSITHHVLPGTEISIRIVPKTAPQLFAASRATTDGPVLTLNEEELTHDENGLYTIKVTKAHASSGINVALADVSTGFIVVSADASTYEVYDLKGHRLLSGADRESLENLPAGFYIVNGCKMLLNK
ncbi:MAG: hypothetical protein K2K72_06215, partial [Duncaniella sp.]|nr:hypothetical protein [Duncaniella sp.]